MSNNRKYFDVYYRETQITGLTDDYGNTYYLIDGVSVERSYQYKANMRFNNLFNDIEYLDADNLWNFPLSQPVNFDEIAKRTDEYFKRIVDNKTTTQTNRKESDTKRNDVIYSTLNVISGEPFDHKNWLKHKHLDHKGMVLL